VIALLLAAAAIPPCAPDDGAPREKLTPPGVQWKISEATATRAPWLDANGWRFERNPAGKYRYVLPAGTAVLAAAEASAYQADAVLRIDPKDAAGHRRICAFLERIQTPPLPTRANIAVIDDGTDLAGEVMNLLARRNLLFRAVKSPQPGFDLTVRVTKEAADPSAFAAKVRRDLGDEKRLVRVFGSEVVVVRLTGDAGRSRLHLLNYGQEPVDGLRVRVLGSWPKVSAAVFGHDSAQVEDLTVSGGVTEFSLPVLGIYAVVELAR
jgi:hypothetical protein